MSEPKECWQCGTADNLVCGGVCLACCRKHEDWCEMCGSFHSEPLVCQVVTPKVGERDVEGRR